MLVGPVFYREATMGPRRTRFYWFRGIYTAGLFGLLMTAWLVLTGTQVVRNVGDLARFGTIVFQILAPLQLALTLFFSALWTASAVAVEKDRRTLLLLLLTDLSNTEVVLGKLSAGLLQIVMLLLAALPLLLLTALLGGIAPAQVAQALLVTLASAVLAGSLGTTVALWREKTFQTLATTVLVLVLWLATWEAVRLAVADATWWGWNAAQWATACSPWQAILATTRPFDMSVGSGPVVSGPLLAFIAVAIAGTLLLVGVSIARVRVWNPSRAARPRDDEREAGSIWSTEVDVAISSDELSESPAPAAVSTIESLLREKRAAEGKPALAASSKPARRWRHPWDNPILWREMRTWAYGRRAVVIRVAYLAIVSLAFASLWSMAHSDEGITRIGGSLAAVPVLVLSLVLVNTQAVTALTSERDLKALDLLLVTDLRPPEIIFGKLLGIFYNTKEIVGLPILLCGYLWVAGAISAENLLYLVGGLLVMYCFVAMLGVHAGMIYEQSRAAIATSLGTVFFLFLGVATCMRLMVAFSGSFQMQLPPFVLIVGGGAIGLFVALGARNPSVAIGLAAFLCPFATFYAITSFLLQFTLGVFLVTALTYGFATAAMLVPALAEFDVATGRTQAGEG